MSDFNTSENDRRLANLVQMGVIEEVDYANPPRARVRIGELLTGWLRMGTRRAGDAHESWGYSVGEEVVVASTSGNLAQGVIVCALANGGNAAQAAGGSSKTVYPGGVIIEVTPGAVNIVAPGGMSITGDLSVTGDVSVNGDVNVTGDVVAGGISLITHLHGGVTPGGADTGQPK